VCFWSLPLSLLFHSSSSFLIHYSFFLQLSESQARAVEMEGRVREMDSVFRVEREALEHRVDRLEQVCTRIALCPPLSSQSLFLSFSLSLFLSFSLSLFLSFSLSLFLSFSLCLFLSLSVSLCFCLMSQENSELREETAFLASRKDSALLQQLEDQATRYTHTNQHRHP
jgi:hypothetical protein